MYAVRGSELNSFLRCRLQWKWAWIDGLRSKKPNNKLFFGTLFHKFLEVYYSTGDEQQAYKEMWAMFGEMDGIDEMERQDMVVLLANVTANYTDKYRPDIDNWETIATELTFAIPLDDEIGYTGTIDLIVRDKRDGKIYFLDHKTTSSIDKYDKNSDMDRQISRYWWALQQLQQGNGKYSYDKETWFDAGNYERSGILDGEIGGFIYNIILRDYPVPPKVLKNGSLSKDKSQKTTFDLYIKALQERDLAERIQGDWLIAPEYNEILEHLGQNPKEFFRRIQVIRNQAEIDSAMTELYATALDMKRINPKSLPSWIDTGNAISPFYRNITTDCHWCQFFDVCKASLDGSNVDYLIDSLFIKEDVNEK